MEVDEFVKEMDQNVQWFCDRIVEPYPIHPKDKEKIFQRMKQLGWIRESEIETYRVLTEEDR